MAPATSKQPKKKNAPDQPMPAWMFPDDDKNPVLNPKGKREDQILKEKKEWDQAVNVLQHKSVSAPLKSPPPALLLTLVGAFLSSYGFNSASRLYTTQLSSRKKLDDWKFELGEKLPNGFPDLVKIFKDWYKEYHEADHLDETSSEDDDDNTAQNPKSIKKTKKNVDKTAAVAKENSSNSSGSSDSSSDESETDLKSENSASSSSASSTSSSDSDADDEQEGVQKPRSASFSSSSDETSSSSDSDSSRPPPHASKIDKRAGKQASIATPHKIISKEPKKVAEKTISPSKPPNISTKSSDSSATLEITSPPKSAEASASSTFPSVSSSDSSSDSSSSSSDSPARTHSTGVPLGTSKRKRSASPPGPQPTAKKPRTPFQRVPQNTKVDVRLASNAYVSHDYGDRAHQDLSVTRGKGFTKEKNKKKRGSYRGGAIDVGGGKGVKFED